MRPFDALASTILFGALVFLSVSCAAKKVKPGEYHPIPVEEQYRIFESLPQVSMVGFADTFTLSREIPAVEQEWLSVLFLDRGFDLLALGGSTFDVWLSMDLILGRAGSEDSLRQARLRGMPMAYQTAEMETLFSWVRETRNRTEPFYVVGFGQEVASSYGWRNQFLIRIFSEILRDYGAKTPVREIEEQLSPLLKLKKCKESGFPASSLDSDEVKRAISNLDALVRSAEQGVRERFPDHSHAKVLRSLPAHFQAALELCEAKGEGKVRVGLEAGFLSRARSEWSKSGKLILIGEFSVLRNAPGALGAELKTRMGEQLFTMATLPVAGELIARTFPPKKIQIKGDETAVQGLFQGLERPSFVPFSSLSAKAKRWIPLFQRSRMLLEGGIQPVDWSKEVNGVIVFPRVSPSRKWYLDHLQFKKEW
jgi:hypothetical protein